MNTLKLICTATAAAVLTLAPTVSGQTDHDPPDLGPAPEGVELLLPRGGIPAIFEPTFVSADQAEIPDDAWILGVAIGEDTRAYSLNILNSHEIVNDVVGEKPIAAVW